MPLISETPNLVAIRTLSKAFGLAALRVGYAVASPEVAARARPQARRPPRSPLRRRASPPPRCASRGSTSRRDRRRARADARGAARRRLRRARPSHGELRPRSVGRARADGSRREGLVVRRFPDGDPDHGPPAGRERPDSRRARRRRRRRRRRRSALVVRTTAETALRISLDARRARAGPRRDRHRLPRPPARRCSRSTAGSTSTCSPAGDLEVDEHHTVEDVLAALGEALAQALGDRAGVTRYGSADGADGRGARDAPPSISCGGRTPRSRSPSPATASAGSRDAAPARARALRDAGAADAPRRGDGRGRPPRRRGGLQGARPRAARRRRARAALAGSTKGAL